MAEMISELNLRIRRVEELERVLASMTLEHANALGTAAHLERQLAQSHVMYEQVILGQRRLQRELAAQRVLTVALGSAVQPFIKQVPLSKWKAVTDAYAAIPEAVQPPAQITRAELDARDDRIYARDLIRERQHRYGG